MSGIQLAREQLPLNAKYRKGDRVHMPVIRNGARVKATFIVHSTFYNPKGWVDYQLLDDLTGQLYRHGAGVREKDLKAGDGVDYASVDTAWSSSSRKDMKKKTSQATVIEPLLTTGSPKGEHLEHDSSGTRRLDAGHAAEAEATEVRRNRAPSLEKEDRLKNSAAGAGEQEQEGPKRKLNVPDEPLSTTRLGEVVGGQIAMQQQSNIPEPAASAMGQQSFVDSGYASEDRKMNTSVSSSEALEHADVEVTSVYSDTSITLPFKEKYIGEIADDILEHIPTEVLQHQDGSLGRLYEQLPRLLKAFSVELADSSRTQESRDAMAFISKHRQAIVDRLRSLLEGEAARDRRPNVRAEERILPWLATLDDPAIDPDETFIGVEDLPESAEEFFDETAFNQMPRYRDLIVRSPSHEWFVSQIKRQFATVCPNPDTLSPVRGTILSKLSTMKRFRTVSRSRNPEHCNVDFFMHWDPVFFYNSQEYGVNYNTFTEQAIALTGQKDDAQATTVSQYLFQVWPSVATALLAALQSLSGSVPSVNGATRLKLNCQQAGALIKVSAEGNIEAVAEVGEALAWLGAAMRSPTSDCKVSSCRPGICLRNEQPDQISWNMMFPMVELSDTLNSPSAKGTCWTGLFRDAVLVEGFPIPRKPSGLLGLEMPLNMISALVGSKRITRFAGCLFIKGFSTILVLTKRTESVCSWHLVFTENGDHISYDDARLASISKVQTDTINIHELENDRHIVGWCSNVQVLTGSPEAQYGIRPSKLSKPKPGFAFDKVSISGGKFVSGSLSFSIAKKDKPIHIKARDDYIMQLKWIAKKYVILYDVEDKRAWLVDGVSALLHLVRASLKHEQGDDFSDTFLFRPEQLKEADGSRVGKHAAIFVLTQAMNQNLPLHRNADDEFEETSAEQGEQSKTTRTTKSKSTHYCLRSRVEEIYHLLEQIIAYQSQASSEDGIAFEVRASPREQLEGFDFMDVATDEDPFWPRVTTLRSTGKGWVDFIREIQAITLFGRGFGELLKPAQEPAPCMWWKEVPKKTDHLTASVSDLRDILEKWGNTTEALWQLVDKIYWHNPDRLFEPCQCGTNSTGKSCDRVQVLLPAKFLHRFIRKWKSPATLGNQGAVIFGHSRTIPLRWSDRGDVKEGDPEDLAVSLSNVSIGTDDSPQSSVKSLVLESSPASSSPGLSQTLPSSTEIGPGVGTRRKRHSRFEALKKMRH